jgi:hypothetical protein
MRYHKTSAELRQRALEAIVKEIAPLKERGLNEVYLELLTGAETRLNELMPLIPNTLSLFLQLGHRSFVSCFNDFCRGRPDSQKHIDVLEQLASHFLAGELSEYHVNYVVFNDTAATIVRRNSVDVIGEAKYMFALSPEVRTIYTNVALDKESHEFRRELAGILKEIDPSGHEIPQEGLFSAKILLVKGPEFCLAHIKERGGIKGVYDLLLAAGRETLLDETRQFVDMVYREARDSAPAVLEKLCLVGFDEEYRPLRLIERFGRASWSVVYYSGKIAERLSADDDATIRRNAEMFNITHVHRYILLPSKKQLSLLEQNLRNWYTPIPEKPVAVCILAQNDHNGAFGAAHKDISALQEGYNVYIFEADTSFLAAEQVLGLSRHIGRKVDLLYIGGHGKPHNVLLGSEDASDNLITGGWFEEVKEGLAEDATIVMYACNTGNETKEGNMILTHRRDNWKYFAPIGEPRGFSWGFERGRVVSVQFNCDEGTACYDRSK